MELIRFCQDEDLEGYERIMLNDSQIGCIKRYTNPLHSHIQCLNCLSINQQWRNKGYGGKVIDLLIEEARSQSNFKYVTLRVFHENVIAKHLYTSKGFIPLEEDYVLINPNKILGNSNVGQDGNIVCFKKDTINGTETEILNQYYEQHHGAITSIPDAMTKGLGWSDLSNHYHLAKFNQNQQITGITGVFYCNDGDVVIDQPIADSANDLLDLLHSCILGHFGNEKQIEVKLIISPHHPFKEELHHLELQLKSTRMIKIL